MNVAIALVGGAVCTLGVGCGGGHRLSVVLITLDTTRADHCSAYGYPVDTTPTLGRLAEQGVRFDAAYAPMSTTGPSHATMFTGLYPRSHGFVKNGLVLDESLATLAERMQQSGASTAAFISAFPVASRFGFGRGFEVFDEAFLDRPGRARNWEGVSMAAEFERDAAATASNAVDWLRGRDPNGPPIFMWVHFFDAHFPYLPKGGNPIVRIDDGDPRRPELEETIVRYDAQVWEADEGLGQVVEALDRLGWSDRTAVIVVGDHGEGLMSHGHLLHGLHLYEEAVRVPFVIRLPGERNPGRVVREPVEVIDLAPTVMDLVAVESGWPHQGRSLAPALEGGTALDPERSVFLQRRFYQSGSVGGFEVAGSKTGVRRGRWKFIVAPDEGTRELFDLEYDPHETRNLATDHPEVSEELAGLLEEWSSGPIQALVSPEQLGVDASDAAALRALGYVD